MGYKHDRAYSLLAQCFLFWSPGSCSCVEEQILLRHLIGSSTLSFVDFCIFNLGLFAVLYPRSYKTVCKHRNGLSWENSSIWRSLQLCEAST